MNEIKTDLFPENLRKGQKNGESRKEKEKNGTLRNVVIPVESILEFLGDGKDDSGRV